MTREEIYSQCVQKIANTNCLLLESATGTGKSKISIDLTNYLINSQWYEGRKRVNILLLVYRDIHKQTWRDEISKWGGFHHLTAEINLCIECYASLKNHQNEMWDIILSDEVHHIGSEKKIKELRTIQFGYFIGLSATIGFKLKKYFQDRYHSEVVKCNLITAIENDILPEPEILLFPLILDNLHETETWEINPKAKGLIGHGSIKDIWKFRKSKQHAILTCTQRQKLQQYNELVKWLKTKSGSTGNKESWLYMAGKRLEFLAYCKNQIVLDILKKLDNDRTITFCRSIEQAEVLGQWCIHSKNGNAEWTYNAFNRKQIDHITAVNILNENANLVDCKYAIMSNLSSSDTVIYQRLGRALRHPKPVIIIPYYMDTREEEILANIMAGYKWQEIYKTDNFKNLSLSQYLFKNVRIISSIQEI